ncbi:formin-like protein 3 isoform X2 [Rhodamnia argentea]|uniref:Formin-like protein 3 isoform X2 n=1 Tax=Rhodamnia argentea TaxID=178133 RepID=A0ABM3H751_9MYRT|nr:formin-like protein 3 isoform X2 [Rhodamnia argentea]
MDNLQGNKTRRRVKLIEMKRAAIDQGVASFCNAIKSLGELWKMNHEWMENINPDEFGGMDSINLEKLVDEVVETLHDLIKVAAENCELMYQHDHKKDHSQQSTASYDVLRESQANQNSFNPIPTTSIWEPKKTRRLPTDVSFIPCLFRSLRRNAVKKPEPIQEILAEASKSGATPAALAQKSYWNAKAPPPPPPQPPPPPPSSPNLIPNLAAQPAPQPVLSKISGTVLPKKPPPPPPPPPPQAAPPPQPPKSKISGTVLTKKPPPPPPPPHRPTTPREPAPTKISGAVSTIKPPPPPPPLPGAKEAAPSPPKHEPPVSQNAAAQGMVDSEPVVDMIAVVRIKAPPPAAPPLPSPKLPPAEVAAGELPPLPTAPKIPRTAQITPSPPLPPALPPLPAPSKGSIPSPPPPVIKGAPPPPPPSFSATKSLNPKKATTRLRRSTQIASLYRFLKGQIEGSNLEIKLNSGRNRQVGGSADGKQGMADTIVEMKKRSSYFQKIEKDVQMHGKTIKDLTAKIYSFQTKDMIELIKFRNFIESHLQNLTDETQVLARFEDFPTKKLEALRAAAALRLKLEAIVVDLQNWKTAPPLGKLLDQIENYFNKMKREIDTLERIKDEESKMFRRNNIEFDFSILVRIKELMVDISSRCMELALKESREAKEIENKVTVTKSQTQRTDCTKMLWRAFQFAFRVYSFAGGHDDHAENLSKELAHEIEASS